MQRSPHGVVDALGIGRKDRRAVVRVESHAEHVLETFRVGFDGFERAHRRRRRWAARRRVCRDGLREERRDLACGTRGFVRFEGGFVAANEVDGEEARDDERESERRECKFS